jgi:hypothetical protein
MWAINRQSARALPRLACRSPSRSLPPARSWVNRALRPNAPEELMPRCRVGAPRHRTPSRCRDRRSARRQPAVAPALRPRRAAPGWATPDPALRAPKSAGQAEQACPSGGTAGASHLTTPKCLSVTAIVDFLRHLLRSLPARPYERWARHSRSPAIASIPSRTSRLEPSRSLPKGSQRPPRCVARNASLMALNEVRLSGRRKPCPSSG